MSVHTAESKFSFQLPNLSYVDASLEEPNLHAPAAAPAPPRHDGLAAWLSRQVHAFLAWRRDAEAARELWSMSDRELMDIGLSRGDIGRAFVRIANEDLRQRG